MTTIAVRAIAIALIPIVMLCGCTTMTAAGSQPGEVMRKVEIGNKVRVVTKDGQSRVFKVTQMTSEYIGGKEVQVRYDDIAQVEVKQLDGWRTAFLVGGIGAAAFVATLTSIVILFLVTV